MENKKQFERLYKTNNATY